MLKKRKHIDLGDTIKTCVAQASLLLADGALPAEPATPAWVQIATEGTYKGYLGGSMEFTFDLALFNKVIANFRKSPSYKRGASGFGDQDVIAWDFHHASEMPATSGTIPTQGTPAQGWVQELEARRGDDGKVTLWALTRWLEPARGYILDGRYKWASVSIVFDAVDAVSGKHLGPMLTSVALTNQPFIEGMQALAASRQAVAGRYWKGRDMYLEPANSPEDALEMLRRMLGLPETADAATTVAEVAKVATWLASGEVPLGVDLEEIVGGIRTVLNLPALASNEDVMAEVAKLISRLQSTSGVDGGLPAAPGATPAPLPTPANPPPPPGAPALAKEKAAMTFLNQIADKLGTVATEAAVLEAIDGHTELRGLVASKFDLGATANLKVICKAEMTDKGVRDKYGPLLKALGVEDPDAALNKLGDLMTQSEELKKIAPELSALRKQAEAAEGEVADADVEGAMASMSIAKESEHYEGIKLAVAHYRKTNSREDFYKKYPKAEAASATSRREYLSRNISGGEQTVARGSGETKVVASKEVPAGAIDVTAYSGSNLMMKTCDFVKASVTGAGSWSWDKVHEHASALVKSKRVHMSAA